MRSFRSQKASSEDTRYVNLRLRRIENLVARIDKFLRDEQPELIFIEGYSYGFDIVANTSVS